MATESYRPSNEGEGNMKAAARATEILLDGPFRLGAELGETNQQAPAGPTSEPGSDAAGGMIGVNPIGVPPSTVL